MRSRSDNSSVTGERGRHGLSLRHPVGRTHTRLPSEYPTERMSGSLGVDSEVGPLRRVLLHRPGLELGRTMAVDKGRVMRRVSRARQEHDAFAGTLRAQGVEVLYVGELLSETVNDETARHWVLDRAICADELGVALSARIRGHFEAMRSDDLVRSLIAGLFVGDLPGGSDGLVFATVDPAGFLLAPLPNHVFTRDASCWIYRGITLNPLAERARRRETVHLEAIYRFHPLFDGGGFQVWYGVDEHPRVATIEGGDVLVIGKRAVLVGMGERTTPQAVEAIARRLFAAGEAERVIAVRLPRRRGVPHLDMVMTMVDHDTFAVHPDAAAHLRAWTVYPSASPSGVEVIAENDVFAAIARALGIPSVRLLLADVAEVLAVRPGVVVAYERDADANSVLRKAGIEVITIPGSELGRGRGGPRRRSCPIERSPA